MSILTLLIVSMAIPDLREREKTKKCKYNITLLVQYFSLRLLRSIAPFQKEDPVSSLIVSG